jgi:endonuclease-3
MHFIRHVCAALDEQYGQPDLGNPSDPLDDLIFIVLSNRASPAITKSIFHKLKADFPAWTDLLDVSQKRLARLIKPCGFANKRANAIIEILKRVKSDFGPGDMRSLARLSKGEALAYLRSLPGVSNKVARCVMIYTLGFDVLPVDAHVFRICKRLGWTDKNRADLAHAQLEELIPPTLQRAFHINAIAHGRTICRSTNPLCADCCIAQYCPLGWD